MNVILVHTIHFNAFIRYILQFPQLLSRFRKYWRYFHWKKTFFLVISLKTKKRKKTTKLNPSQIFFKNILAPSLVIVNWENFQLYVQDFGEWNYCWKCAQYNFYLGLTKIIINGMSIFQFSSYLNRHDSYHPPFVTSITGYINKGANSRKVKGRAQMFLRI